MLSHGVSVVELRARMRAQYGAGPLGSAVIYRSSDPRSAWARRGERAENPVVAARAFHGVVALVYQHHHGMTMIGLDLRAVLLVRIPCVLVGRAGVEPATN